jgi:hypothetical protein
MKIEQIIMVLQILIVIAVMVQPSVADQTEDSAVLTTTIVRHIYLGDAGDTTLDYPGPDPTDPSILQDYSGTGNVSVNCNEAGWKLTAYTDETGGKLLQDADGVTQLQNALTVNVNSAGAVTLSDVTGTQDAYTNGPVGEYTYPVVYLIPSSWFDEGTASGVSYSGTVRYVAVMAA